MAILEEDNGALKPSYILVAVYTGMTKINTMSDSALFNSVNMSPCPAGLGHIFLPCSTPMHYAIHKSYVECYITAMSIYLKVIVLKSRNPVMDKAKVIFLKAHKNLSL